MIDPWQEVVGIVSGDEDAVLRFTVPAGRWSRWTQEAADSMVGMTTKLRYEERSRMVRVTKAEMRDEGLFLDVTVETI